MDKTIELKPCDELLEMVARAIHAAHNDPELYPWWHADPDKCELSRGLARAALESSSLVDEVTQDEALAFVNEALRNVAVCLTAGDLKDIQHALTSFRRKTALNRSTDHAAV